MRSGVQFPNAAGVQISNAVSINQRDVSHIDSASIDVPCRAAQRQRRNDSNVSIEARHGI